MLPAPGTFILTTLETVSITPREDGKVEIMLRMIADHTRLTDCATHYIRAGCESFERSRDDSRG